MAGVVLKAGILVPGGGGGPQSIMDNLARTKVGPGVLRFAWAFAKVALSGSQR